MRTVGPAFATLALVAACSSAPPQPDGAIGRTSEAIINGQNSDKTQNSVVLIMYPTGGGVFGCTGTLLAANLVLTARHCVSSTYDQPFGCDQSGIGQAGGNITGDFTPSNMLFFTGATRPADPFSQTPAAHGKQFIHDSAKNLCNHDLALVVLDQEIPNAQIAQIRLDQPVSVGESFTAVGWGVTMTTDMPITRQQRPAVKIEHVGPVLDANLGIAVPDHEFQVGEAICQGDSGGPGFDAKTGAVIGVVSRGGNGNTNPINPWDTCVSSTTNPAENWYSATFGFKDVIMNGFAAVGQDPWIEGGPDPRLAKFGVTCSANTDCRSNLCIDQPGGSTQCTQDCSSDPCPDGYDCKVDSNAGGQELCLVHVDATKNGATGGTTTTTTKHCSLSARAERGAAGAWPALGMLGLWAARRARRPRE
jgi:hypothetical protein